MPNVAKGFLQWQSKANTSVMVTIRMSHEVITTPRRARRSPGTYKKPEAYHKQAVQHEDTNPLPQYAKNEWHESTPKDVTKKDIVGDSNRTGSDSNESSETRGH